MPAVALLVTCKGGLYTDQGNDFPCDFSAPAATRDSVCAHGDVCGVNNLCRTYRYEGPQFEGGATEPHFDAPVVLHPGPIDQPIIALTRHIDADKTARGLVVMGGGTTATLATFETAAAVTVATQPYPFNADQLICVATPNVPGPTEQWGAAIVASDPSIVFSISPLGSPKNVVFTNSNNVLGADRLRSGNDEVAMVRFPPLPNVTTVAGSFDAGGIYAPLDFATLPDGGGRVRPLDVRYLPATTDPIAKDDTVLLSQEGFWLRRVDDGGFNLVIPPGTLLPSVLTTGFDAGQRFSMRHDPTGTVFAVGVSVLGFEKVVSTWRLDRGKTPTMVRLWSDCSPCSALKGRVLAFAAVNELGSASVEVLCGNAIDPTGDEMQGMHLDLIRVTGSFAADENQFCEFERLTAPFDLSEVNLFRGRRPDERLGGGLNQVVFDDAFGFGVALGGRHGQVWASPSGFSSALPVFLDRVPLAFGLLPGTDGGVTPAALTDRYAAAPRAPGMGFQSIDFRNASQNMLPENTVGAAFIGQAIGWGIMTSADVVQIIPPQGVLKTPKLVFGPRLLDSHGDPAPGPYFGEAITNADGSIISFVLTADDSVYFTPAFAPTPLAELLPSLSPQLTPQPSSPIRSFALERSAVGTNGIDRVRAYAVAGQSLFLITLDGTPPRWSAKQLVVQGGEPVEVWMDHPLGGLARVGYRDGEVFTLPGGFQLVNELPRGEGVMPPRVLDYENLGGWPVALTSNGLFEAHYPVEDGHLQNRFPDGGINKPMDWARVMLPDGTEPWLNRNARLQVWQDTEPQREDSGVPNAPPVATLKVFRLLVYTDQQVIEVGTLRRH